MTTHKPVYLTLRETSEVPDFEAYGVSPEAMRAFNLAMGEYIMAGVQGLWLGPEDGADGHTPDGLAVAIGTRVSALCDLHNGDDFESPIESQLAAALLWLDMDWAGLPVACCNESMEAMEAQPATYVSCFLTPQAKVGAYRADLLLWFQCGKVRGGVAIECDGHDFHEKTKEQASRDKRRDREILSAGFPVMRFAGSEIFRDPVACAQQVRAVAASILGRVSRDGGLY